MPRQVNLLGSEGGKRRPAGIGFDSVGINVVSHARKKKKKNKEEEKEGEGNDEG